MTDEHIQKIMKRVEHSVDYTQKINGLVKELGTYRNYKNTVKTIQDLGTAINRAEELGKTHPEAAAARTEAIESMGSYFYQPPETRPHQEHMKSKRARHSQ